MSDYTKTQVLGIVWELLAQARNELIRNLKKELYWLQYRLLNPPWPLQSYYLPAGIRSSFGGTPTPSNRLNRQVLTQTHRQMVLSLKDNYWYANWFGPGF